MTAPRYLAGIGLSPAAREQWTKSAYALDFTIIAQSDTLLLAAAPGTPVICLGDEAGFVIGTVFEPGARKALGDPTPRIIEVILASKGKHLVDVYWGNYVALIRNGEDVAMLRSPFGTLPCLYRSMRPGLIVGSDIDLLQLASMASLPRLSVDYEAVTRYLLREDFRHGWTCLEEIEELVGGTRLTAGARATACETLWSPWRFVHREQRIDDEQDAVRRLRQTAISCIRRRTDPFEQPLVLLSGGLDSSIVAASLAASERPFLCFNTVTRDAAGDERVHAELTARHLGRELVTLPMATGLGDIEDLSAVRLPRPAARSFEQHIYALARDVARQHGCDAIVDGGGGDNIFCSLQSAAPAADCLLEPAWLGQFWRICSDIGAVARVPAWTVAWPALRRAWNPTRPVRRSPDIRFLGNDARQLAAVPVRHPWLEADGDVLPGRAGHVALLIALQGYVEDGPYGMKKEASSPLVSQPLIEHCLRIASPVWFARGRNRAAARRAFEDYLPPAIAWRRDKGAPDSFIIELLETNRTQIRDHLCGGLLAAAGILDVAALARVLTDSRPSSGTNYGRIMRLADAESWARGINRIDPVPFRENPSKPSSV